MYYLVFFSLIIIISRVLVLKEKILKTTAAHIYSIAFACILYLYVFFNFNNTKAYGKNAVQLVILLLILLLERKLFLAGQEKKMTDPVLRVGPACLFVFFYFRFF